MNDFFDPDGPRFVPILIIFVLFVLFFIGLCVNHWKTKKKREKEQQQMIFLNPLGEV